MENILNKLIDLRDVLTESSLFTVGILLIFGYVIGRLVVKIKLPEITGYIIARTTARRYSNRDSAS